LSRYNNAKNHTVFSTLDALNVMPIVFVVIAFGEPTGLGYTVYALVGHCLD
jgi:hypothetical protein